MSVVFIEDLCLTEKQREAYRLVFREGRKQCDAAREMRIKPPALTRLIARVAQKAAAKGVSLPRRPRTVTIAELRTFRLSRHP